MDRCTAADGTTIAYTTQGDGDGPPLVFVHGITDTHEDWSEMAGRLAVDHRCVSLDLRGHGESGDADDYGALSMALDVAAVVDAEQLASPVVVGHSLGAVVATAFAASEPTLGVVNVDQPLRLADFAAALRPLDAQLRDPDTFHPTLAAIFESMMGTMLDDATRAELATHREAARQEVVMGVWDLVLTSSDEELEAITEGVGAAITVPYLSLHGLDPGPGYAEWLGERIAAAQVEQWPDHGHYLHLVDPDRFEVELRRFIAEGT